MRTQPSWMLSILVGLLATVSLQAQQTPPAKPMTLTPQDYIDIQQLSARYAFAIDACTNGGADYADLYTDDGEFSVSQQWGVAGNRKTKGRAALIKAAGGDGAGGCVDPKTTMGYGISHLIVNLVVTPTPDGAVGKSYLLAIGVGGDPTKIERQGGYDDVYVKTAAGWRFKSRIHVFPNMSESVQFGRGRRGQPPSPSPAPGQ
jgi:SnoaL-like domain